MPCDKANCTGCQVAVCPVTGKPRPAMKRNFEGKFVDVPLSDSASVTWSQDAEYLRYMQRRTGNVSGRGVATKKDDDNYDCSDAVTECGDR